MEWLPRKISRQKYSHKTLLDVEDMQEEEREQESEGGVANGEVEGNNSEMEEGLETPRAGEEEMKEKEQENKEK